MQHVNVHTGEIFTLETGAFTGGFSADDYAPVVSTGKVFDADGNEFVFNGTVDQLAQDYATVEANLARVLADNTEAKEATTKDGSPRKRAAGAGRKSLTTANPHAVIIRHSLSFDLNVDWLDDLIIGVLTRPEEDFDAKFKPFTVSPADVRRVLQHDKISSAGAQRGEISLRQSQDIAKAGRTAVAVVGSHIERHPEAIAHVIASMVAEAEASEAVAARVVVNAGEVPAEILALYEDGQYAAYGKAVRAFRDGSWKPVAKKGFTFNKPAAQSDVIAVLATVAMELPEEEGGDFGDVSLDDLNDDESLINPHAVDMDWIDEMESRHTPNQDTQQGIRDLLAGRQAERTARAKGNKRPKDWTLKQEQEDTFYQLMVDAESSNENFIF